MKPVLSGMEGGVTLPELRGHYRRRWSTQTFLPGEDRNCLRKDSTYLYLDENH